MQPRLPLLPIGLVELLSFEVTGRTKGDDVSPGVAAIGHLRSIGNMVRREVFGGPANPTFIAITIHRVMAERLAHLTFPSGHWLSLVLS